MSALKIAAGLEIDFDGMLAVVHALSKADVMQKHDDTCSPSGLERFLSNDCVGL